MVLIAKDFAKGSRVYEVHFQTTRKRRWKRITAMYCFRRVERIFEFLSLIFLADELAFVKQCLILQFAVAIWK